eukprot:jgi/Mesen1/4660/ME000241S03699
MWRGGKAALINLYQNLKVTGKLDNWLTGDPCGKNPKATKVVPWKGVGCAGSFTVDSASGETFEQITSLDVSDNQLAGKLPGLSYYYSLIDINFSNNTFVGPIPDGWQSLNRIQNIYLQQNKLEGAIPTSFKAFKNLTVVDVSSNLFSGDIPDIFSSQQLYLEYLNVSNNLLGNGTNGGLPPGLASMPVLTTLDVSNNPQLGGPIPPAFINFQAIEALHLSNAGLTGTIPDLSNLTSLVTLVNAGWQSQARVGPSNRGIQFYYHATGAALVLWGRDVSNNKLYGQLPATLSLLQALQVARFNNNTLVGGFPPRLSTLKDLHVFLVNNNALSGEIPVGFGSLRNLTQLALHDNELRGAIPYDLVALGGRLSSLELQNNVLSGPIPNLAPLVNLRVINLSNNNLSGPIPATLAKNLKLTSLRVSSNHLTVGELASLPALVDFRADGNLLTGPVPAWLGTLETVNLAGNRLSGPIPPAMFGHGILALSLAGNSLTGSIPFSLGVDKKIYYLQVAPQKAPLLTLHLGPLRASHVSCARDVTGNKLGQDLDQMKPPLSGAVSMRVLKLSGNAFKGALPSAVVGLSKLADFLTGNQLCSEIPGQPCAPPGPPGSLRPPPPGAGAGLPPGGLLTPPGNNPPAGPAPKSSSSLESRRAALASLLTTAVLSCGYLWLMG